MDERQVDKVVEAIDRLTDATTELAVKIKRLTNNNPFTNGHWDEVKNRLTKPDTTHLYKK